jgi:hypothetical protein
MRRTGILSLLSPLLMLLFILPAAATETCSTPAGHLVCGTGLHCMLSVGATGPVPNCMPPGSISCTEQVCLPGHICLLHTVSGKLTHFCALPGETVCGTGICGAGYSCITSGTSHACVVTGSKACGPFLRCSAAEACYSAENTAAHQTMYHCAPPGSTVCGPSFVCVPGTRCDKNTVGKETFYRCLKPGEH